MTDVQRRLFPDPTPPGAVVVRLTVLPTRLPLDFRFGGAFGVDMVTDSPHGGATLLQGGMPVAYVVEPPLYIEALVDAARRCP